VLTTGARLPVFYHSSIATTRSSGSSSRIRRPRSTTRRQRKMGSSMGTGSGSRPRPGRSGWQAKVTAGMLPGVVSTAHGWWQGCTELGLPGYGWDGANANLLISGDEHDPPWGSRRRAHSSAGYPRLRSRLSSGSALLRHHQAGR